MRVAIVMWPDAFEDWYEPQGVTRELFLDHHEGEWIVNVASALVAQGVEVHVVYSSTGPHAHGEQRTSGATVHFVPAPPVQHLLRRVSWGRVGWRLRRHLWRLAPPLTAMSLRLRNEVRRLEPDVIVVQDYETARFDVLALLLRSTRTPIVALDTGGSARPGPTWWRRQTVRNADVVLATHETEAQRVRDVLGHHTVSVWPAPVRTDIFVPTPRAAAKRALGLDDSGVPLVVFVGRLHPVKGLHALADACAPLPCRLVLVGSGSEEEALRARGQSNLVLTGRESPGRVALWLAAATIVVSNSTSEGQPVAVLEAMACGRAVVATAVGGVPDVVESGATGWLVTPGDSDALRAAIRAALSDEERADAMGAAGRQLVLERFSWDAAGSALQRLLSPPFGAR